MLILIAEDDLDTALQYEIALEERRHKVILTYDGDECVNMYKRIMNDGKHIDVVLLDYRMPKKNGMQVAKEILRLNPKQRIIFASAYVQETLIDSVKQLRHVVELLQKPFELDTLVNTIENEEISEELGELNEYLKEFKEFELTQEQIDDLLHTLRLIKDHE